MILREIILGGLSLPFKIYFQPSHFRNQIADLAPELPRKYSLRQARNKWPEPEFRRAILILFAKMCVSTLWGVVLANLFSVLVIRINWRDVAVGIATGAAVGAAIGVFENVAVGVAVGVLLGAGLGGAFGFAPGSVFGFAPGAAFGFTLGLLTGSIFASTSSLARHVMAGLVVGVTGCELAG